MPEKLLFKLSLADQTGKKTDYQFSVAQFRDLIDFMLASAAAATPNPKLKTDVKLVERPVSISGLHLSAIDGAPELARLTLLIGSLDLQFSVPLDDLMAVFERLNADTEALPKSQLQ